MLFMATSELFKTKAIVVKITPSIQENKDILTNGQKPRMQATHQWQVWDATQSHLHPWPT